MESYKVCKICKSKMPLTEKRFTVELMCESNKEEAGFENYVDVHFGTELMSICMDCMKTQKEITCKVPELVIIKDFVYQIGE